jgi:uncharacterized membrane protein
MHKLIKQYGIYFDDVFYFGVILKAIGGSLELIGALVVGLLSTETFFNLIEPLRHIGLHTSEGLAGAAKEYVFFYLLSHGIVRVGLAYALLKEYIWAYPLALVVLGAFTFYQLYLLSHGFSLGLVGLILFNILIAGLTLYEWRKLRAGGHLHRPQL